MDLGKIVKDAVQKQGMLAWQYNTIGVSDAITMGGDGALKLQPAPAMGIDQCRYEVLTPEP